MQSSSFISAKSIDDLSNIIYRGEIPPNPKMYADALFCLKKLKLRINLLRLASILLIVTSLAIFYLYSQTLIHLLRGALFYSLAFTVIYFLVTFFVATLIMNKGFIPYRYTVLIHRPPKAFTSIILVTHYLPKGRKISIIPIDSVAHIGMIKKKIKLICNIKEETTELFIEGKNGEIIARFGSLGDGNAIIKVLKELKQHINNAHEKYESYL